MTQNEWQPIETAPDETPLLTINANVPGAIIPWVGSKDEDGWASFNMVFETYAAKYQPHRKFSPTHWMPLPPPPESKP